MREPPEVMIVVRQVIDGEMVQTIKKIDVSARAQARISLADHAIDEGLAELRAFVPPSKPNDPIPSVNRD